MFPPDFEAADITSVYAREQAIEDGVLIDMNREPFATFSREAGLKSPIAMTAKAYREFVEVSADAPGNCGQDEKARWWDVVFLLRWRRREISPCVVLWSVAVCDPDGRTRTKELKGVSGPDDVGNACLTFMLTDED